MIAVPYFAFRRPKTNTQNPIVVFHLNSCGRDLFRKRGEEPHPPARVIIVTSLALTNSNQAPTGTNSRARTKKSVPTPTPKGIKIIPIPEAAAMIQNKQLQIRHSVRKSVPYTMVYHITARASNPVIKQHKHVIIYTPTSAAGRTTS